MKRGFFGIDIGIGWIIALIVLVLILIGIGILYGKGENALEFFKSFGRFRV